MRKKTRLAAVPLTVILIVIGGDLLVSKRHDPIAEQTGRILRKIREEKHLPRESVAEQTGIGLRHLAAIELGEKNPSVNTLYHLIRGMGASSDRIFYPELFEQNTELEDIMRLLTGCTAKQRKLILAFIRMLLDPHNSDISL